MKTFVVIGVTGTQGGATARALLARGAHVRGMTRRPDSPKARALAQSGLEIVVGDLDDAASLARAFHGADGVYGVTDFFKNGIAAEVEHGRRIADVCKASAVPHLVFASVASADRAPSVPHFASKWTIEEHIRAIGQPATILCPTLFMEDLTDKQYVPPANWGMLRNIVGPDRAIHWISAGDVGSAAADVFFDRDRFLGQRIPLVGERCSIEQARQIFEGIDHKRPFAIAMPSWIFSRLVSKELVLMWQWLARESFDADLNATKLLFPKTRNMATWLREKRAQR
jgi:uncharacterized protein YbjT (DUF2867 family)